MASLTPGGIVARAGGPCRGCGLHRVSEAFHAFPPHTAFGTVFFTMTGMHAFHVITGLAVLAIALRAGRASHDGAAWPVEAAVKYWHFVDVVWVFFYPALYLIR